MANICTTNIRIYHKDSNKLKEFFDNIEKWLSIKFIENCSENWLGNIVGNSGLAVWDNNKGVFYPDYNYRGFIISKTYDENGIFITQEDKWSPNVKLWIYLCKKYLPDAEVIYTAEESGNGVYYSNDEDIVDSFYIDIWHTGDSSEKVKKEVSSFLTDLWDTIDLCERVIENTDFEKIKEEIRQEKPNITDDIEFKYLYVDKLIELLPDDIYINKWKEVDPEDL